MFSIDQVRRMPQRVQVLPCALVFYHVMVGRPTICDNMDLRTRLGSTDNQTYGK